MKGSGGRKKYEENLLKNTCRKITALKDKSDRMMILNQINFMLIIPCIVNQFKKIPTR
jgi:hypothetical protein